MNIATLIKKAGTKQLTIKEQIAFVRSANKCLSSFALLLQQAREKYEDAKHVNEILKKIQRSK